MKLLIALIFSFTLLLISTLAQAVVTVQANVDRNELGPEDSLTYTISVSADGNVSATNPRLPTLNGFQLINEWTSEEQRAVMQETKDGGREFKTLRTQQFNFMLQPNHEGQLMISASEVTVDGQTYRTKPITVKVSRAAAQAQQQAPRGQPQRRGRGQGNGLNALQQRMLQLQQQMMQQQGGPGGLPQMPGFDDDDEQLFSQLLQRQGGGQGPASPAPNPNGYRSSPTNPDEAFFVQVETDKREAFVGEQITASWYLYTRGSIRDLDTLKYPNLHGFWKEEIEIATQLNFTDEVVNGVAYKKALLASYALFPTKEGQQVIDSYEAKASVLIGNPFTSKAYAYTKTSDEVKINVKPLPNEGRPADFTNAVGQFQVTARTDDTNIVTDQPFSFKIRFEGRGNAKNIDIPNFPTPEGMELYDTQKDAKFFRTGTSFKEFNLLLIPRKEGQFIIPKISVAVFDPISKKYVHKETEPVTVIVRKGTGKGAGLQSSPLADQKQAIPTNVLPGPITTLTAASAPSTAAQTASGLGLFTLVMLTLFWRARIELGWGQRKKDLGRQLQVRLKRARDKQKLGDWRGVGVEVTNTANVILGQISGLGGSHVQLEKLLALAPPSIRREIGAPLTKSFEAFQVLTFAPVEVVGPLKDPERLNVLLNDFEQLMQKAIALGASGDDQQG